jgi:hypothetical protein
MPATNELLQEGRYRVSQPVSQDGTVFEAYDTVRNTTVLVREFPVRLNRVTTVSQQESIKLAFANQAKALSEIDHESLLHVQDYFAEIDRQFLVMESVEGDILYDLLNRNKKPFEVSEVLNWADQLLDALDYLHSRRPAVIHRTIRPQNLSLHSSGKVKLLGVGIDTGAETEFADTQNDMSDLRYSPMEQIWPGLDAASQKVITNSYDERSERILKEPLDARSDIYSLGATLYFLVTGREPVDPLERSIDILEGKLDPLREPTKVDSRIPAEISDVLMKALEIKRENRYDSAVIMRQVLNSTVARVAEREAEEAREQAEAAEIIRLAAQSKAAVETKASQDADEAEKRRQEEQRYQQMREAEQERLRAEEKAAAARAEAERLAAEHAAAERAEAERLAAERAAAERAEAERLAAERAAAERAEAERVAAERAAAERAEAERLAAERAAAERAEAERLAAERAAAERAEAEASVSSNDAVLEIPVSAEVAAYRDSSADVDEKELAAVLEEIEKAEREAEKAKQTNPALDVSEQPNVEDEPVESEVEAVSEADVEPVQVFERPLDAAPESFESTEDDSEIFSVPESSGSSLPIPAIAGAIGLVVVIAIAGWFALSGSSEPTPQPQPVQVQAAQPAQPEPNRTVEAITTGQTDSSETSAQQTAVTDEQAQASSTATAPAAKPKKAEAKKEPEKKKAVTVDDLINDN